MRTAPCAHCGLPVPRASRECGAPFCCSGCHVAFQLGGEEEGGGGRSFLARVLLSLFLAMGVMVFSLSLYGEALGGPGESEAAAALRGVFQLGALALSTIVLWLLGLPLAQAVVAFRRVLSIDALVLAGALAAWAVSVWSTFVGTGEAYFDTATMVLCLYGLGRYLDTRSRERAHERLSLAAEETRARVQRLDGAREVETDPRELRPGDRVRLRPGELAPIDGSVVEGRSFFDTSQLTGEAEPRSVGTGGRVLSGWRTVDGTVVVEVEAAVGARVVDEVQRALASALSGKSELVLLADRFAAVLVPVVVTLALWSGVSTAITEGLERGLVRMLTVVLISCPCALGIATPLAFWVALGEAWRRGALVRGGDVLERLARARRVLFDKTGTLTSGALSLREIELAHGAPGTEREALRTAAALEQGSEHAIGRSLRDACGDELPALEDFRVLPGLGVEGRVEGADLRLVRSSTPRSGRTSVDLLVAGTPRATFHLETRTLPGVATVLRALEDRGLASKVLTGDSRASAEGLAAELAIEVESELLPADKVERVRAPGTVFVGDGLNDTGALCAADVGISVPGSAAVSLELADVNLLNADLRALPGLLDLARRAVRTARFNLLWACAYNAFGLTLAVRGELSPIVAALAMVLSSMLVVLNSARLASSRPAVGEVRTEPRLATHIG